MPRRGADYFELLANSGTGLAAASQVESLAHPFSDRHAAGARGALDFTVFWVFENYLESFGHVYEYS